MDQRQDQNHHQQHHLSTTSDIHTTLGQADLDSNQPARPAATTTIINNDNTVPDNDLDASSSRLTRAKRRSLANSAVPAAASSSDQGAPAQSASSLPALGPRRSARVSLGEPTEVEPASSSSGGKGKKRAQVAEAEVVESNLSSSAPIDRKGKKRAVRTPTPPPSDPVVLSPPAKRTRLSAAATAKRYGLRSKDEENATTETSETTPVTTRSKGKGKAKAKTPVKGKKSISKMPKKVIPKPAKSAPSKTERPKKGDRAAKHLVEDDMDEDDGHWVDEPSGSGSGGLLDDGDGDDDMDGSGNDEDDDEDGDDEDEPPFRPNAAAGSSQPNPYSRLAQLAGVSGLSLDQDTAAALFGGEFRVFGGMSGFSSRFKRLKNELKSSSSTTRLSALRECSETLLIANEDTLGGSFSITSFATEFIAILKGQPNIDPNAPTEVQRRPEEMDEDALLAAALAMSTGGEMPSGMGGGNEDEMECQLVACRCLAHLLEALPGSGHTLVHLGAVPALCSKLTEISYIELAEQTLQTMEKISAEYPSAIVREGGLGALLNFLPFFSTNVQRTAVTAAANCCRNISSEHYPMIKEVFPTLRDTLSQGDQRLVEQATLAVVRTIEAYRHNASHLEGLLDLPTVVAINALLMPSGGSPLIAPSTYTHLLKVLTLAARCSATVTIAFLEASMTNTVYQILTGVLPPAHDQDEKGESADGQGLAGGVADMVVLQNLAHRPKDQVEEALALICELLPPLTKEGVFDTKAYTEKALSKVGSKTKKPERTSRRKTRASDADALASSSAGPATPTAATSALPPASDPALPAALVSAAAKAKKDAEQSTEQRLELLKAQPKLIGNFIRAIVPVLVDVYAASVAIRVRTKVLLGLVKAVGFADATALKSILVSVPMASFLGAIISSKDNPFFVLCALQLVEMLATKLAEIYQSSFSREGVAFEIEAMAQQELSTAKAAADAAEKEKATETPDVKKEPVEGSPVAGTSTSADPSIVAPIPILPQMPIPEDLKPLLPAGFQFIAVDPAASPSGAKKAALVTPEDANIIRARVMVAKKVFAAGGEDTHEATSVLNKLQGLVKKLCLPDAKEAELRDALKEVAEQFGGNGPALSSFELLKSGLVDGLLEFVDIDGTVSSASRRAILYETFTTSTGPAGSALTLLVKRLHESLGRLESFEVETAFGGTIDPTRPSSTSSLSRTIRVRLQAEEGSDIPKHVSSLSVTIQVIAPLQQVHDWIRPRVADANYASSSGLPGILAAYAASSGMPMPRGGPGSASRLLSALASAGLTPRAAAGASAGTGAGAASGSGNASSSAPQLSTSAPESNSRLALPPPANPTAASTSSAAAPETPTKVTRRRSARLSGLGVNSDAVGSSVVTGSSSAPAAPLPILGSSAPEPSLLPDMPMDMDFDDEEEYSDEDYDAEVYEEDMEEEIMRPVEKVVNMNLVADGTRVEAKTPDGTRVETPNQAGSSAAGAVGATAGPSGVVTPSKTGSYAGAVKAAPVDWHLEFTLNGTKLSLGDTLYGAVHKYGNKAFGGSAGYGNMVTIMFKKVDGPAQSATAAVDAASPGSTASVIPSALEPSAPTTKILRLLRVVHKLTVEAREANSRDVSVLDESLFVNNKLTAKLSRQLEEIMILASDCLPVWSTELPKHFAFLFPFETRYSFLQSTSFGYGRLISRYQTAQTANRANSSSNHHRRDDLSYLARIPRQKVRISRAQLLESCAKVLELYGTSGGILEIEYFDEIGTGLGPTLEFYSLASKGFAKRSLKLWRDEDESKAGEYVFHPSGLFPAPLGGGSSSDAPVGWFKTLGIFVARALLDSRIIDVNLNTVMLKLILDQPVSKTVGTLKAVDPQLAKTLERLQVYVQARREIEAMTLPASTRRNKLAALTVNGAKLADLSLDFTLPGYNIELKPGGASIDVDDNNLEEYLESVLEMTLGSGIARQVKAFQEGFSLLFGIEDLRIFSPPELGLLFGNTDEDWSRETIEHAIKADHGYNLDSRAVQNLIEVMSEYDKERRRDFLQFITGAPKLPIGGFRGLSPPFTVVRKPHEAPFKADDYLPSVMTCAQYLKMPDYSNKQVLAKQISRAMHDGGGSFHLS